MFNDDEIDIESFPMITVVKEGERYGSNYMPVRKILSEIGYGVAWDYDYDSVLVFNEDYLQNAEDWIHFDVVLEYLSAINEEDPQYRAAQSVQFNKEFQVVHVGYDVTKSWDVKTAVFSNDIYVARLDLNTFFSLHGIPLILSSEENAIVEARRKEFENNRDSFVRIQEIAKIVNSDENNGFGVVAVLSGGTNYGALEFYKINETNREVLGTIDLVTEDRISYVRKADINPYLMEYGFDTVE